MLYSTRSRKSTLTRSKQHSPKSGKGHAMHTPKVFERIPSLAITSTLRYEGITLSRLEFTCSLRMTPAAHWVGVQEHMNNRKHMNAVLNSIEEKHTAEEQAAFTEKWKRACNAHTKGFRTNTKPCDRIDTDGYYKREGSGSPKLEEAARRSSAIHR